MNDFLAILMDLGFLTWRKLPAGSQSRLLHPHRMISRRQKERMKIQARISKIAESLKIDAELTLGLPRIVKESIREEARIKKTRMSPLIREKLGLKAL